MTEYRDITSLKKQIADFKKSVNSPNSDYMTGYVSALSATEGIIAGLPTADVVEVVRCKDCKHRGDYGCPIYHETEVEWDDDGYTECETIIHDNTTDDSFCSYGERR